MATKTGYLIVSRIYMGGGTLSEHRTLAGAKKAMARHDRAVKHLNRFGGSTYHDARICHADGTTADVAAE